MRVLPDRRLRPALEAARDASRLFPNDARKARARFMAAATQCEDLGVASAWARRGAAACSERLGQLEPALAAIEGAFLCDPLDPEVEAAFERILGWCRAHLKDLAPGHPQVPQLYAALQRLDEVDVAGHLAMVRHLLVVGCLEEAASLALAATTAFPAEHDAWLVRAAVAHARGDELAAAECEAHALLLTEPGASPHARDALA